MSLMSPILSYMFSVDTMCDAIANGINTEPIVDMSPYAYGTDYVYVCSEGFKFDGDLVTTCMLNGSWSLQPPMCIGKMYAHIHMHIYIYTYI